MTITYSEAISKLLKGEKLSWDPHTKKHKAGKLALSDIKQRQLFDYFLTLDFGTLNSNDEQLFDKLKEIWNNEELGDPALDQIDIDCDSIKDTWLLQKLECKNFGGLCTLHGTEFTLEINGKNFCLEGYNGSGKTSLISAILWCLTEHKIQDQYGPIINRGEKHPVYSTDGDKKKIGDWSPLISYPENDSDLQKTAEMWVKLTFKNQSGDEACACRSLISDPNTSPKIDFRCKDNLTSILSYTDTNLLMPTRLPYIGFGDRSEPLYEALKVLTGLDKLADIAGLSQALNAGNRAFKSYAKKQGIEKLKANIDNQVLIIHEREKSLCHESKIVFKLEEESLTKDLKDKSEALSKDAGDQLDTLKDEILETLNLANPQDRQKVKDAIDYLKHKLNEKHKGIKEFGAWTALKQAIEDETFSNILPQLRLIDGAIKTALSWDEKQHKDNKLRLKALASQFLVPNTELNDFLDCPLCETKLSKDTHGELIKELNELKEHHELAERKLAHACRELMQDAKDLLPPVVQQNFDLLSAMNPRTSYEQAIKTRFIIDPNISKALTGFCNSASFILDEQLKSLPSFDYQEPQLPIESKINLVNQLYKYLENIRRIFSLALWWRDNKDSFVKCWSDIISEADDQEVYSKNSFVGMLNKLSNSFDQSEPLDELSKLYLNSSSLAEQYYSIYSEQKLREEIAESISPLKDLNKLVTRETDATIETLSTRVSDILDEIYLRGRFSYQSTDTSRKRVTVEGSFHEGMKIDGTLVANSSWIRSILWAFLFALREQKISKAQFNAMPLMIMDDPQLTFDPQNRRKWVQLLERYTETNNDDKSQLMLTTHDRGFFSLLDQITGTKAQIVGVNKGSPVSKVINGDILERLYRDAKSNNDDFKAFQFVDHVRVHCEDLLKIMLRPEALEINGNTIGACRDLIDNRSKSHVSPFNRTIFTKLNRLLDEKQTKDFAIINQTHHGYDGTIGLAEADTIYSFWNKDLRKKIHDAFRLFADFDAFNGEQRTFAWSDNILEFPATNHDNLKSLEFSNLGQEVAAYSNGSVGDGIITINEITSAEKYKLYTHQIYRVLANTIAPVADVGDAIIVHSHAEVNSMRLVAASYDGKLVIRRFEESDNHPDIDILSGQSSDPLSIPSPILIPKDKIQKKKIVGTLFLNDPFIHPSSNDGHEFSAIDDFSVIERHLKDTKLFKVSGDSMTPIALDGQSILTKDEPLTTEALQRLNNRLVIAIDESGARFFKRMRLNGDLLVLESLNSDHHTQPVILSISGNNGFSKLQGLLSVCGVLFELPDPL